MTLRMTLAPHHTQAVRRVIRGFAFFGLLLKRRSRRRQ
jgi:hypothetical protein